MSPIVKTGCAALVAFGLLTGCVGETDAGVAVAGPSLSIGVSAGRFDAALSPYGSWIYYHGRRVWQPSAAVVGPGFVPYLSDGSWVATDAGWSFESTFDWGWATFHYGRWFYDPLYGWMWEPGLEWAPAWVSWWDTDDFIGWAPLAPAFVRAPNRYVFCDVHYFAHRDFARHLAPASQEIVLARRARPIAARDPRGFYRGPAVARVAVAARLRIQPVRVIAPRRGEVRPVWASRHREPRGPVIHATRPAPVRAAPPPRAPRAFRRARGGRSG